MYTRRPTITILKQQRQSLIFYSNKDSGCAINTHVKPLNNFEWNLGDIPTVT